MIHNRYLPESLHRVCNAAVGFFGVGAASFCVNAHIALRFQTVGLIAAVILTILATCLLAIVNPKRFSVVEGIAGDVGYDELAENRRDKEPTGE
jgi:hypothetical protein